MKSVWSSLVKTSTSLAIVSFISISVMGTSAHALTNKECREQFNAAKKAGSLSEKTFKDFKATHCQDQAAAAGTQGQAKDPANKPEAKKAESAVSNSEAVFPDKIDAKYASEKEGVARRKTCLDQYKLNKESGKNGNLKWIQKGGGYYSECVKHLKAQK
ncbi:hypothetical protein COMNV_01729 [Commensalibacter sp. Nvir]|uniref:hypothetical protein n=1 Tax=Commensalibacter sp. Nvir TaxID=3069817 RepID=UPI002D395654|nr:hypothetical protein COMNV_01729 [Commensalibacter sp. Nvir]